MERHTFHNWHLRILLLRPLGISKHLPINGRQKKIPPSSNDKVKEATISEKVRKRTEIIFIPHLFYLILRLFFFMQFRYMRSPLWRCRNYGLPHVWWSDRVSSYFKFTKGYTWFSSCTMECCKYLFTRFNILIWSYTIFSSCWDHTCSFCRLLIHWPNILFLLICQLLSIVINNNTPDIIFSSYFPYL